MKSVLGFFAGALLTCAVLWMVWPDNQAEGNRTWSELSGDKLLQTIQSASQEELQEFISHTLHETLPANYVYQPHVVNAQSIERANAAVKRNYPEFTVNSREEYYAAIRKNPELFRKYTHELTSVRLFFSKGSSVTRQQNQEPEKSHKTREQ
jgi:hypothetical protein